VTAVSLSDLNMENIPSVPDCTFEDFVVRRNCTSTSLRVLGATATSAIDPVPLESRKLYRR
jgi:hypothetical protein